MKKVVFFISIAFLFECFLSAQSIDKQEQWLKFKNDFNGEIHVEWDRETDAPRIIMGNNIFLSEKSIDEKNADVYVNEFVNKYQDLLNFKNSSLKLEGVTQFGRKYLIVYQQYYNNVEVWNAKLRIKVTEEGQVTLISSQCYQDIQLLEKPGITSKDAEQIALTHFNIEENECKEEAELLIYPDRE